MESIILDPPEYKHVNFDFTTSPTVEEFIYDKTRTKIIMGPIGSGKTSGACAFAFKLGAEQEPAKDGIRYTRGAVIRETLPELKTTTIKTWQENFPAEKWGDIKMSAPITHHLVIPGKMDIEVIFLPLTYAKDEKHLLSLDLSWIYFNEMREFTPNLIEAAGERIGRFPAKHPDRHGVECTYPCLFGDTNYPSDSHWLKALEDDCPANVKIFKQPGGVLDVTGREHEYPNSFSGKENKEYIINPGGENIPNLPNGYYENIVSTNSRKRVWVMCMANYGVLVDGEPVTPEYDDQLMAVENLQVLKGVPLGIGMDIGGGTLSPAAVIGQRHPRGTVLIHAEVCCSNMGVLQFADQVNQTMAEQFPGMELEYGWGDPSGSRRDEIHEKAVFDHLKSKGIPMKGAPTNKIETRIEATRAPMTRLIDGKPGFLVNKRCKVLRSALGGQWFYRRIQVANAERYAQVPDKGPFSHIADADGYFKLGTGEHAAIHGRDKKANRQPIQAKTSWDVFKR